MSEMAKLTRFEKMRAEWLPLSLYQRFETVVAWVLTALVAAIIVVALWHLSKSVIMGLVFGLIDPLDQNVFQTIFAEVLTLMIALEFNHTLQLAAARSQSIIQTKVVLLIALLALARKFIVLDIKETDAAEMLGLAAITLSLGVVYWLLRERDDRLAGVPKVPAG
jgi:uncharacterized membrane protein (DUF373 family)